MSGADKAIGKKDKDAVALKPASDPPSFFYRFFNRLFLIYFKLYHRTEVRGAENVPRTGGCMMASTHQSMLDPPLVGIYTRREIMALSKHEILEIPIFGWICGQLNAKPLRRGGADREAIKLCAEMMKAGYPLVFFPEGTRTRDGLIKPPQPGFAMILKMAGNMPYVPTLLEGSFESFRPGTWFIRPCKIRITYGKPRYLPEKREGESSKGYYQRCADELEAAWRELGGK
jgi:1-acyl-sn-glycerol-3-phosphate acyltransferase